MIGILMVITALVTVAVILRIFKKNVRAWALNLSAKVQLKSLRVAIHDADSNKATTGRKNMVVFDTDKRVYVPIQKKQLKTIAGFRRNTSNRSPVISRKKVVNGKVVVRRKSRNVRKRPRPIDMHRAKHIEEKSLYKTA